jgi:hypothetical protein
MTTPSDFSPDDSTQDSFQKCPLKGQAVPLDLKRSDYPTGQNTLQPDFAGVGPAGSDNHTKKTVGRG